jgi:hypothetical protein
MSLQEILDLWKPDQVNQGNVQELCLKTLAYLASTGRYHPQTIIDALNHITSLHFENVYVVVAYLHTLKGKVP